MANLGPDAVESLESFRAPIIAFGGRPGVGTSTVARTIANPEHYPWQVTQMIVDSGNFDRPLEELERLAVFQNFIHYPLGNALRAAGYRPHPSVGERDHHDMDDLRAFHRQLREQGDGDVVVDGLVSFERNIVLFEKIRHPDDVARIQERGGFFIFADAPEEVCDERYLTASSNGKHRGEPNSAERKKELEEAKKELTPESEDPFASDILACADIATEIIDFSGDVETTIDKVQRVICRLALEFVDTNASADFVQPYQILRRAAPILEK